MQDHRDLEVGRPGHPLTVALGSATTALPKNKRFGLTGQRGRAASSIPATIAKRCGREGEPDLRRFLPIALGSAGERDYFVGPGSELGPIRPDPAKILEGDGLRLKRHHRAFSKELKGWR